MGASIAFTDFVRDVQNFPEPGITFKDITPLLAHPPAFAAAVDSLVKSFDGRHVDAVAAIEARGFLFGPSVARQMGVGFVPIRKPGKLPSDTYAVSYELEYGTDELEMHSDAPVDGASVLLVDDVVATGGTLGAAKELVERAGGTVVGASVLIELLFLGARVRLADLDIRSVVEVA